MADQNMDDVRAVVTRAEAKASGSSRYFSGKPCPHGHNADRYTINATCVVCFGERDRALKAKKADRELARKREWKTRNPEKVREQSRQWYDKNRAKVAERKREWHLANTEIQREKLKAWRSENADAARSQVRNRRARKASAEGFHTSGDIAAIRAAQHDRCAICREPLKLKGHVDHIEPIARGGSNWPRNLQLLCRACNSSKSARDPVEFMQLIGRLC